MGIHTTPACKYESFNALIRINEPELLHQVFLGQLDPGQPVPRVELFERQQSGSWRSLQPNGSRHNGVPDAHAPYLDRLPRQQEQDWRYDSGNTGRYAAYKPCSHRQYAMFFAPAGAHIDEDYVQLLFSFYCHQFTSIEGVYRDSLTGLYNRRAFDQRMAALIEHSRHPARRSRASQPAVFALLDIDHFKEVNDRYGHVQGDEMLTQLACMMSDSFREYDLLFRYGGEEFALVLMDMDESLSQAALERFRRRVEETEFVNGHRMTVSIGYCRFEPEHGIKGLIERADKALYAGKRGGRNLVRRYPLS